MNDPMVNRRVTGFAKAHGVRAIYEACIALRDAQVAN